MNARMTMQGLDSDAVAPWATSVARMFEERLPFTVRVASSSEQLRKAVSLRHHAYGRHVPALGELLRVEEAKDRELGCVVLIAESKLDGEPVGTMRIQTNRHAPLAIEESVALPASFKGLSLAEATRLAVATGRIGRVVKIMLFKAFYLYCVGQAIDWIVIGARPPLDRMYEALLLKDLLPEVGFVPLKHAGNLPHRILGLEVDAADALWRAARHPMYDLYVNTRHPDIKIWETDASVGYVKQRVQPTARVPA